VAPTVRDGAVVLAEIGSPAELPRGVGDEQAPGHYRLRERGDQAWFGYAAPANSWKSFLHPAVVREVAVTRDAAGDLEVAGAVTDAPRHAFLGVRGCELAAIAVQDRVLRDGHVADPVYTARRDGLLIVAVSCGEPSGLCFCASMGTGPRPRAGYDLLLTEILDGDGGHRFLAEAGSDRGTELLDALRAGQADADDLAAAAAVTARAESRMGRTLDPLAARDVLRRNREHPQWDAVAARCLACGNCTLACPTCFCTDVVDGDDVSGTRAHRERRWASCFSADFSYIHGGSVRTSTSSRYRQWLTHKLSTWWDQFDSSGCVGCGRCIAWCPAGIDLVAEVAAIAATEEVSA
jgi:sulfhydrogenase subunit beta (sulfur reductase)